MDKLINKAMRILITGSNGFLGQKVIEKCLDKKDITIFGVSKSKNRNIYLPEENFRQVDITDFEALLNIFNTFGPTHIIHTAAITSVEACEEDQDNCERVNVLTTEKIAEYCNGTGSHLTFISTDFVFDGKDGPYREGDPTAPCNAYGQSKLEAEQRIIQTGCNHAILRTILVYGAIADKNRSNIVLWGKNKLSQSETISVVNDQWRMPTWVDDLADACILAVEKRAQGVFHISSNQLFSILEIVQQVAKFWKLNPDLIKPISAEAIGQARNRPQKTGFILTKAEEELAFRPTPLLRSFEIMKQQLERFETYG